MGLTVWRSAFPHVPQVINMEVQMLVFVFSLVVAIYCHVGCIYHTIKDVSHTINDVSINFGDIVADPIGVAARLVGGGWYLLSQTASGPYQSTLDTSRSDRHLPLW
ncbi:hypothetical protein [Limnospira fusiformis]|uniref:hypothetical protein n=1 Tax=Limnospira fusiformis TaxID=54297 RepID=UPI00296EA82A